jgi:hypothetical protein
MLCLPSTFVTVPIARGGPRPVRDLLARSLIEKPLRSLQPTSPRCGLHRPACAGPSLATTVVIFVSLKHAVAQHQLIRSNR